MGLAFSGLISSFLESHTHVGGSMNTVSCWGTPDIGGQWGLQTVSEKEPKGGTGLGGTTSILPSQVD